MGRFYARAPRAFWVALVISSLSVFASAFGAEGDGATTPESDVFQGNGPANIPDHFGAANLAGMNGLFGSCINDQLAGTINAGLAQLGAALQQAVSGKGGTAAIGKECGSGDAPGLDGVGCRSGMSSLKALLKSFDVKASELSCQQKKADDLGRVLDGVAQELECFDRDAKALAKVLTDTEKAYQDAYTKAQGEMAQVNAAIKDREQQFKDATEILERKDPPGLLAVQNELRGLMNKFPSDIEAVQAAHKSLVQQKKSFEERVKVRQMALAMQCFDGKKFQLANSNKKSQNDPSFLSLPMREYIKQRVAQMSHVDGSGRVIKGDIADQEALSKMQEVDAVLSAIASKAPSDGTVPNSPEQFQKAAQQGLVFMTPDDIANSSLGKQLGNFNLAGFDLRQFVLNQIKSCYTSDAKSQVNAEIKSPNSVFATAKFAMDDQESKTLVRVKQVLHEASESWTKTVASLTGTHSAFTLAGCENPGQSSAQIKCMEDARANIQGLLKGNVQQAQQTLLLKADNPSRAVSVRCEGVNGCVTALTNVKRNLIKESQRLDADKTARAAKFTNEFDGFTNQVKTALQNQSKLLNDKLFAMNKQLAQFGAAINLDPVQGEEAVPDKDGLRQPPKNLLGFLGAKFNPPMPNVGGSTFSQSLQSVESARADRVVKKKAEVAAKTTQLADAKRQVEGLIQTCPGEKAEDLRRSFEQAVKNCSATIQSCENAGSDEFSKLFGDIGGMGGFESVDFSDIATGLQGVRSVECGNVAGKEAEKDKAFDEKKEQKVQELKDKLEKLEAEKKSRQAEINRYMQGQRGRCHDGAAIKENDATAGSECFKFKLDYDAAIIRIGEGGNSGTIKVEIDKIEGKIAAEESKVRKTGGTKSSASANCNGVAERIRKQAEGLRSSLKEAGDSGATGAH